MRVVTERFFRLTAENLMSREMLTFKQELPVQVAVRALLRAQVGGAPVVDERGRCVGVFSLSDCSRPVENSNVSARTPPPIPGCVCSEWEMIEPDWDTLPADAVSRYMTPDPVTVHPATPLTDLAQRMVDARIHRLIVAREDHRPLGIVSSTDVLAALARAGKEQEFEESGYEAFLD